MRLHLHGPAVTNDGSYVDAGVDLTVGDGPDEIAATRAAQLLECGRAIDPDAGDVLELQADQAEHEASFDEFDVENTGR